MTTFAERLRPMIQGDVLDDQMTRTIYSVDASIYEIEPVAVVIPRTVEDILITVEQASAAYLPIIARGAGTGIAGGCIGAGVVIDTSKYLNRILAFDKKSRTAGPW